MNDNTFLERPISINNNTVTFHPWKFDPNEKCVDFSQHINSIKRVVNAMVEYRDIRPIIIEGVPGSGKSTLATLLKHSGKDVTIIDALKLKSAGYNIPSSLVRDRNITYIFDEVAYGDSETISKALEHSEKGGLVILMLQDISDISRDEELIGKCHLMRIDKNKLVDILN